MSYPLTPAEIEQLLEQSNYQRYQYFIEQVQEHGQIWSLANDEGWVTLSADDDNCLPIWPHPDLARLWATNDWADCQPKAVDLDTWLKRWTKGLIKDQTLLVVFPNNEEEALLIDPQELDDDLRER